MCDEHNAPLRVEVMYGREALLTIGKDWDELFECSIAAPPYLSRAWVTVLIDEERFKGTPSFVLVWSGTKLVALLPLTVRQSLCTKIAVPIGTGLHTYLGLLSDPNYPAAIEVLAKSFKQEKVADVLYINDLSSEDEATGKLFNELAKNGFLYRHAYRNPCHYINMGISYDEYLLKTKSANRRKKLRYEEKMLFKTNNTAVQHYIGKEISMDIVQRIAAIQEASWMKRRGAVTLNIYFNQKLLLNMAKNGFAHIWILTIDGEDAAFVYTLIVHKQLHYYQTSFKLKYESSLSVGKILTMQVIRHACENDILHFNFGQGDAEYKRFWATNSHEVKRAAVGRGFRGYLFVLWFGLIWFLAKHKWIHTLYRGLKRKVRSG
ncbi:MAG: GNAT family N-acetyltransferase [Sedimentisphaerales bacterium]|jgi:CelD/BcsL family acetyltransferase involved in cellulose biosynthesis